MNKNSFPNRTMRTDRSAGGGLRAPRFIPALVAGLLLAAGALIPLPLAAHGGEDHGTAEAAPAATPGGGTLTTHASTGRFELLLKYPPPEAGKPVRLRFFLADYATNRAVEDARFVVASRPRGLSTQAPPSMVAPGIYELVGVFPEDTVYSLVATLAAGDASEQIVLPNVYAGEPAQRFLAEHGGIGTEQGGEGGAGKWLVPLVILAMALLGILSFLGVRARLGKQASGAARNPESETTDTTQSINAPARREEENR